MKTSIIFFGNEKLATGVAEPDRLVLQALETAGYEIEAAITSKLEPGATFSSKIAVLAAYGHILPESLLDKFPLGIINIHPSLLPIYRGPTPIEQAILDGATDTGVSIMKLTSGMDAGPIYTQGKITLSRHESKQELTNKLQALGAELLVKVLPGIIDGSAEPVQQDESNASYGKKIAKADGEIDWSKSAMQIEREIRAYLGWPGSYTKLAGKDVIITQAHTVPQNSPNKKPGDIETDSDGVLMIECADGYLCVERLKPAGKREMTSREFLAGRRL